MASSGVRSPLRVVGRYTLQHEIASGGMASVHLGKMRGPLGFTPIVAIKTLHPQFARDPEFVRMFLDEARLAARIRHPNIVPVIDVHAEDDILFLVLEYIHGESLARLVSASGRAGTLPPLGVAIAVVCDVLHGLHAAHEAKDELGAPLGIVHRDVSPQNVLVGADGVARVLDFGIAKAAGRLTTTSDGQVKGKFAYMPPEQLRGESVDRRADVYAAAVVLWELLTARKLFRADSEGHTVQRVLYGAVEPPSAVRPDVPPALDAVVLRGLSRERADRFSTAKEMAIALAAAVLPAAPTEVSEWVEARALDALEQRAKLVEEIELSVNAASAPLPVSEAGAQVLAAAPPSPRRAPFALMAGVAAVLVVGLSLAAYATRSVTTASATPTAAPPSPAPAAAPSVEAPRPLPPAATPTAASSTPGIAAPEPAFATPRPSPTGGAKPPRSVVARTPPVPAHGTSAAAPASTPACTRRNADGEIEFDTQCLRAQHP